MSMHKSRLVSTLAIAIIALLAMTIITSIALAATPGTQPTQIGGSSSYPKALVGRDVNIATWTPNNPNKAAALVASGSSPFGDVYNLTKLLMAVGLDPSLFSKFIKNNRGRVPGINIGFNQWGEFASVLDTRVGGGIAVARFNSPSEFQSTESWVTQIIPANDWINGWAFGANITYQGTSGTYCIRVVTFAAYSNRTDAGAGKGAAVNVTKGQCTSSLQWPSSGKYWVIIPPSSPSITAAPGLTVVADTPRLLVARAGLSMDLSSAINQIASQQNWADLAGTKLVYNIYYTLVFPKAFPYALIYYNWTLSMAISKFALGAHVDSTAFTVRYELDFYNGAGQPVGAYMRYNPNLPMLLGQSFDYFVAASGDTQKKLLFFSAVYPSTTEFHVQDGVHLAPLSTNGFQMFLPTGTQVGQPSTQPATPFVIHQWMRTYGPEGQVTPAKPFTLGDGSLFAYGMVYNGPNADIAMENVLIATVFSAKLNQQWFHWGVAGRDALPTDVLGMGYITSQLPSIFIATDKSPIDNPIWAADTVPSLMYGGNAFGINYLDHYGRASLKPYFNNTWLFLGLNTNQTFPVAGSNITTVGGPIVNLLTQYTQDFAWYSPFLPDSGSVVVPVWNRYDEFASTFTPRPSPSATPGSYMGYAVVSIALDANGTALFQVWGYTAEDTYWASRILNAYGNVLMMYLRQKSTVAILTIDYAYVKTDVSDARPFQHMPQSATVYFFHPVLGFVGQVTIDYPDAFPT